MIRQRLELTWYNKDQALIPTENGKYGYTWVDPADPRYCETRLLFVDGFVEGEQTSKNTDFEYSERADLPPQDDNLLIHGESGDVLEALTRIPEFADKYVGQVKLIYIDPPFNTAQTFASYEDNLEHSIWLTMMRDRLLHMKKLLSEDGSIWVHLDDVEVHRMRLLLDEVFGPGNFVAEVVWQKADSPRNDAKISSDHDVLLAYAKSEQILLNRMERTAADNARFSNPDGDVNGVWWSGDRTAPNNTSAGRQVSALFGIEHPITGEIFYPAVGRQWAFRQERILDSLSQFAPYELVEPDLSLRAERSDLPPEALRSDVLDLRLRTNASSEARQRMAEGNWPEFFVTETGFGRKSYPPAQGQPARTWWTNEEVGHNRAAKSEMKALFPSVNPFSTPKPERLLERVTHIGSSPGDIVLDVFAGSGTTAAVAQKMGRRWVTCELLESTFNQFTLPRLTKVVKDEDPGGITVTKGERVPADGVSLPDGVSADDAAKFTSVLNKLIADDPEAKKDPRVKTLKAASKTRRTKATLNWRGGGGFAVAHLAPACFDYDPELDRVMLTEDATGPLLIESVAANLGFSLIHPDEDDDYFFHGKRGASRLYVQEGVATTDLVDDLVAHLASDETFVLAATSVMDGVREHTRKARRGSRVVALPDDVFGYSEGNK